MLASDLNNREFQGAMNPDELLNVTFYIRTLDNEFESERQGRPVKYDAEFVSIKIPGRTDLDIERFANEIDKRKWPRQWEAFQNSQSRDQVIGTRVEDWPAIPRHRAEELKAIKFFTVEQIANASDMQKQRIGMDSNQLQMMAKAFLGKADETADAQAAAAELAKRDKMISDLQNTVNLLLAKVNDMEPKQSDPVKVPKKRGRPAKVKHDDNVGVDPAS